MKSVFVITMALMLCSCAAMRKTGSVTGPPEVLARDAVVGGHAALLSLEQKHSECGTVAAVNAAGQSKWNSANNSAVKVCTVIDRGVGAVNLLIDASEAYCSGPAFDAGTGPCQPPAAGTPAAQQLLGKLQTALGNVNTIMADVKTAIDKPAAPAVN